MGETEGCETVSIPTTELATQQDDQDIITRLKYQYRRMVFEEKVIGSIEEG